MVRVGVQYPLRLRQTVRAKTDIPTHVAAERRELGLEIEPRLVGGLERGLRRTPRVETDVVEPVLLQRGEVPPPWFHLHRRGARERPYARVKASAQKHGTPVQDETRTVRLEIAQSELHRGRRLSDLDRELVQHGIELAPLRSIRPKRHVELAGRYATWRDVGK